ATPRRSADATAPAKTTRRSSLSAGGKVGARGEGVLRGGEYALGIPHRAMLPFWRHFSPAMIESLHDPGAASAAARAPSTADGGAESISRNDAVIRVGKAGWADRALTARGVFYPDRANSPESEL